MTSMKKQYMYFTFPLFWLLFLSACAFVISSFVFPARVVFHLFPVSPSVFNVAPSFSSQLHSFSFFLLSDCDLTMTALCPTAMSPVARIIGQRSTFLKTADTSKGMCRTVLTFVSYHIHITCLWPDVGAFTGGKAAKQVNAVCACNSALDGVTPMDFFGFWFTCSSLYGNKKQTFFTGS